MERGRPRILKGTRDFLPQEMARRNYVLGIIRGIFERYGYEPIATPALEYLDVLTQKYGLESEKLIYKLAYRDGETLALRYDLTVPMSRLVAMNLKSLPMPFKRYQIQPVWRADKPQKGRLREFYQCDFDVVGSRDMLVDAESIAITCEILTALGFRNFIIRVNHRKILNGMVDAADAPRDQAKDIFRCLDKLDKIGPEGVRDELRKCGIDADTADKVLEIIEHGREQESLKELASLLNDRIQETREGAQELLQIFSHLRDFGVPEERCIFDPSLVRGLDYYTGSIFESEVREPKVGSLSGGGRYDDLIGSFAGVDTPACGSAIGLERILTVMAEQEMFPPSTPITQVLVTLPNREALGDALSLSRDLRKQGLKVEVYLDDHKLKKQLNYANRRNIPLVIIAGEEELSRGEVGLRDMITGQQRSVSLEKLAQEIKAALETR